MTTKKKDYFRSRLFLTGMLSFLLLIGFSCEKESDDYDITPLLGTWQQVSRTIDGKSSSIDSTRLVIQINSNNICIICDSTASTRKTGNIITRSGWNISGGLLNIATDLPASYTVTTGNNKLNLERVDFNSAGNISRTMINYESIANIDF
ncbi:MAG TPA: hypothetical protein PKH79_01420 [Prolixibacteraceae bacterium]|nr:hypothetical protein [Prolixibacteraceae bacterium]HPS11870.1 hypothetical protein [Prolixibacteraceae bacterium]